MKKFLILISLITIFFVPGIIFASEIVFSPLSVTVAKGEFVKINVYVLPGEDRINAAEGKIIFPNNLLSVSKISYGNSILSFWPQIPAEKENGVISFSGVTPGGYDVGSGRGLLFSVIFKGEGEGRANLEFKDGLVLKDDGAGTATLLKLGNGNIIITKQSIGGESKESSALLEELNVGSDHELPESFTPLVGSNPTIFDGKYFLVFATVDKQSGIDYFEVKESLNKSGDDTKWIRAESPYQLSDQALQSFILVKAVDKAGNFRIETLALRNTQKFYQSVSFWVIIILIFLIFFLWRRKIRNSQSFFHEG
ncbi:cohesin domain-containing protein [Candidatus Gracilibacteria bacterium]|nr:cohesin domain-containing protein [Candidatus Gracilibacteria bacterium]